MATIDDVYAIVAALRDEQAAAHTETMTAIASLKTQLDLLVSRTEQLHQTTLANNQTTGNISTTVRSIDRRVRF